MSEQLESFGLGARDEELILDDSPALIDPIIIPGEKKMSLVSHLEELRKSLIVAGTAVIASTLLCFVYNDVILRWLMKPVHGVNFIFTTPGEAFVASLRAAFLIGLFLAIPIILERLFWFVGPGLTQMEKKVTIPVAIAAYILFALGILFAYYFLLPAGLHFLIGFAPSDIKAMLSIGQYIDFTSTLLIMTGLIFELPLVLLLLATFRMVTSQWLRDRRRWALMISFIVGAVVTPSIDVVTQSLLAGALFGLYEGSIWLIKGLELYRQSRQVTETELT